MSRREDFDNALWSDPDFLALSTEARMTYIWSWTNPRCGMAGIYKVAPAQAALETGYSAETIVDAWTELGDARFAFYERHVLFVRTRVRHLRQKTPQIATSIRTDLAKIADDHPLKAKWMEAYARHKWLGIDRLPTLTGPSTEAQREGSLEQKNRVSRDGHPTVKGNGNGKGTGKGPLGRGVGRETRGRSNMPQSAADARQWAEENFPGVNYLLPLLVVRQLTEDGQEPTVEAVRARLEAAEEEAA